MESILPQIDNRPEKLRPYLFHGVVLQWSNSSKEAVGDCPFCGKEGKFSVNKEDGRWRCFVCAEGTDKGGGNIYTFLRLLWEKSDSSTIDYEELSTHRGLLNPDTVMRFGICRSDITGEWLIPAYNVEQSLTQLYKYVEIEGKFKAIPTPTLGHQIFGLNGTFDPKKQTIYVCEGPWDMLALWETMSQTKMSGGKFLPTSSIESSLLAATNIIAVPGCQQLPEKWSPIFSGNHVALLFDNDHDRKHPKTGAVIEAAAYQAMRKHSQMLAGSDIPPEDLMYMQWGKDGQRFDQDLPSGYDLRDYLKSAGNDLGSRINALTGILGKISPIPVEWLDGASRGLGSDSSGKGLREENCESYAALVNSFRKAMKWTDGLDCALSVMLASVASTMQLGDQLWIKIIGPASCISGDTEVKYIVRDGNGRLVNKKGGPLRRLWQRFNGKGQVTSGPRWSDDVEYFVPSVTDDGVVILNKVQDVVSKGVKQVIGFTTLSGKYVEATNDHEILTEHGYRRADSIKIGDRVYVNPGKTQKKGRRKPAYRKEVLVKNYPNSSARVKIVQGYRYYRIYLYRAIYEAARNGLSTKEYISRLNSGTRLAELWTIPQGCEIHHIDGNPSNNELENLSLVASSAEHHNLYHNEESKKHLAINMELDEVVAIRSVGSKPVYDIVCSDPYRNFVAGGVVVHNCGKSTLCEAISTNKTHILAKSTLRGFFSGYNNGEAGGEDFSLLSQAKGKTLIIKDGDTLLKSPNRDEILSQARDIYDTVSRTSFKNKASKDYEGYRMTMILCGTSSLRELDSSELGERFLDCVIMHGINDELEDEILWRVVNKSCRIVTVEASEKDAEARQDEDTTEVMRLTAGYVTYLRKNSSRLLSEIQISDEIMQRCTRLGKFVAFMRARPSRSQDEVHEREFAARLVIQLSRLAMCLAVVLNRREVDEEVMRRVQKVAMDTGRGLTLRIVEAIYRAGEGGLLLPNVATAANITEDKARRLLLFMRHLGIVKLVARRINNVRQQVSYVLSPLMYKLYYDVTGEEFNNDE